MRIRRKRHLKERLDAVRDILFVADFDIPNANEAIKDKKLFDFKKIYGNDNNVCLEVGCGKGLFVCEMAKLHPNVNYMAVELLDNIIVMACERCKEYGVSNVRYFNCGADYLPRYIDNKTLKKVYLNFSPPFPGDRYENRRLTCDRLLGFYTDMLVDDGEIELKTDDKEFFDYSFNQMIKFGYKTENLTDKLKNDLIDNVKTEYETKFSLENKPIYYLIARK